MKAGIKLPFRVCPLFLGCVLACLFAQPGAIQAQDRIRLVQKPESEISVRPKYLADLAALYFGGCWTDLQDLTKGLLHELFEFDETKNHPVLIVFGAEDRGAKKIVRYIWPDREPYVGRLQGVSSFHQVFLSEVKDAELLSDWVSTRQENPLLAQLPDVIKVMNPLEKFSARALDAEVGPAPVGQVTLYFSTKPVTLPDRRAKLEVSDRLVYRRHLVTDDLRSASTRLWETYKNAGNQCIEGLSSSFHTLINREDCHPSIPCPGKSEDANSCDCPKWWSNKLEANYRAYVNGNSCSNLSSTDLTALMKLRDEYLNLVVQPEALTINEKSEFIRKPPS